MFITNPSPQSFSGVGFLSLCFMCGAKSIVSHDLPPDVQNIGLQKIGKSNKWTQGLPEELAFCFEPNVAGKWQFINYLPLKAPQSSHCAALVERGLTTTNIWFTLSLCLSDNRHRCIYRYQMNFDVVW